MKDMIIYFVFSVFISRPTFLPSSKSVSVFSFIIFILLHNKLISSAWTNN